MPDDAPLAVFVRERDRDRTLVLSAAGSGRVRVREWDTGANMQEATERTMERSAAAKLFERAHEERCLMTPGLHEIRAWLAALPR